MAEYTPTTTEVLAAYVVGEHLTNPAFPVKETEACFRNWLTAHDEQVRAAERERCAQVALGPSHSGILHDGATARDIALAIRTVPAEQKESN